MWIFLTHLNENQGLFTCSLREALKVDMGLVTVSWQCHFFFQAYVFDANIVAIFSIILCILCFFNTYCRLTQKHSPFAAFAVHMSSASQMSPLVAGAAVLIPERGISLSLKMNEMTVCEKNCFLQTQWPESKWIKEKYITILKCPWQQTRNETWESMWVLLVLPLYTKKDGSLKCL